MALDNRRAQGRRVRRARIRRQLRGTDARPRLCVFRSEKHIYAQIISDDSGQTLTAASTLSSELRDMLSKTATLEAAKQVGVLVASKSQERGIAQVVFDRNGFPYLGRVRALAEAAREGGLKF
jgi:large subunit ribosomal protein L18